MTEPAFSYARYREIIGEFVGSGYEIRSYDDVEPACSHLIIRHDVDFSPEKAEALASVENELGVKGHYYFLLQTEFYNLASASCLSSIARIRSMGHEVGLHFDASLFADQREELDRAAAVQCEIMEKLIDAPVLTVSFHRPAKIFLGDARPLGGRIHTYQPRFFSDIAYVSDSGGAFSYGEPLEHPAFRARTAMQLLTHPIWWTEEGCDDRMFLLDDFLGGRAALLQKEAQINCYPYADHVQNARTEAVGR